MVRSKAPFIRLVLAVVIFALVVPIAAIALPQVAGAGTAPATTTASVSSAAAGPTNATSIGAGTIEQVLDDVQVFIVNLECTFGIGGPGCRLQI